MYGNNDYRDYIMHHGIKGQQWGVQNGPPYPLDEAGKARFSKRKQKRMLKKQNKQIKKERKAAMKNRRNLSDEDIKKLSERIQAEAKMKDLIENDINHGKKVTHDILESSGKKVAVIMTTGAILYGSKILIESGVLSKSYRDEMKGQELNKVVKTTLTKMAKSVNPKEAGSYITPRPKQK